MLKLTLYVFFSQPWVRMQESLIKHDRLLEKYDKIWKKVSKSIKKEFDGEPVYNGKYLKTKIKSSKGKINTNF